ncbi:ribbon-helix-helix protein, CopG family, partial [Pseudomonas sp. SH1-B]
GVPKHQAKAILQYSTPEILSALWVNVSRKQPLPVPSGGGTGKPSASFALPAKREAEAFLSGEKAIPPVPRDVKSVLFSFKIGADDLDHLRRLGEHEGESVAVLIRQAVRDYLRDKGVRR